MMVLFYLGLSIGVTVLTLALRDAIQEHKRERILARVRDWERRNPLKASHLMNWRRGA